MNIHLEASHAILRNMPFIIQKTIIANITLLTAANRRYQPDPITQETKPKQHRQRDRYRESYKNLFNQSTSTKIKNETQGRRGLLEQCQKRQLY